MCDQHGEDRQAGTWWFLLNDRKITVKELDSPFRWFECRKCKLVPCKVDTLCSGVTSNIKETENEAIQVPGQARPVGASRRLA